MSKFNLMKLRLIYIKVR